MNGILTAAEAAEKLKIHINTIYRYLETKKLKGHQIIGKRWRIRSEDLENFVKEKGK